MKTLYLIRHAKSSWNFELPDHDRPLAMRGRHDVLAMGLYLSRNYPTPDQMITSTASRALYTALYIGDEWNYPEEQLILTPDLYHASPEGILNVMQNAQGNSLALFGHNPGFTELVNLLQPDFLDNLPTCGVMALQFQVNAWSEVGQKKGKRLFYKTPKMI